MLFSVVIPVYNAESTISDCLGSVLNQTFDDYEIVIINDGSTDTTLEVITEYIKLNERIKVYSQKNQGPFKARQYGVEKATGKYILFLDADDRFDISLMKVMHKYTSLDLDIFIFRWEKIDENGNLTQGKTLFSHETLFNEKNKIELYSLLLETYELNSMCIKAVKRHLLLETKLSIDEKIINGEDLLQTIPLITKAESIMYLDLSLYKYINNKKSTTNTFNYLYYKSRKIIHSTIEAYLIIWLLNDNKKRMINNKRFLIDTLNSIPLSKDLADLNKKQAYEYVLGISKDPFFRNKVESSNIKNMRAVDIVHLILLKNHLVKASIYFNDFRKIVSRVKRN